MGYDIIVMNASYCCELYYMCVYMYVYIYIYIDYCKVNFIICSFKCSCHLIMITSLPDSCSR